MFCTAHRKPSARVLQVQDDVVDQQQDAFEGYSPEERPGRGRGRSGKRGRGSMHHISWSESRHVLLFQASPNVRKLYLGSMLIYCAVCTMTNQGPLLPQCASDV